MSINSKIFITLFSAVFVTTTGVGVVAPLLPVYAHEMGGRALQVGLIFGAFSLTRSLFIPVFGRLSDQKGRKPFLTAGLLIYFIVSLSYVFSNNVNTLILLRLGQGFGSAMILPVAQAYIGSITPSNKEGRIMGMFNLALYGGLSAGPLLGGVVTDWFNIQCAFLSMGVLTLFGFILCLLVLPQEKGDYKTNSSDSAKFISYREVLKDRTILSLFLFRTCFTFSIGVTWAFLPLMAGSRLNLSSSSIGILVMINVFVAGIFQTPMGYLADRFNKRCLVVLGGLIAIISVYYLNKASSFGGLLLANGFFGLAGGVSIPALMAIGVIAGRKTGAMGSVMGLLNLSHSLGMLAGPVLAGILVDLYSFDVVFPSAIVVLCVGTLALLIRAN